MSYLKQTYSFGGITLPNNIFYAPLAGCSDYPFRQMAAQYRPGLFFCEMVKMDALIRNDPNTYHILDYEVDMHPVGAQICGSKPSIAGKSAKIIEELGFDVVDLNCGCPVDKVTKDGSGSGMLRNPDRIGEVLSEMVAAVDIPVTVKIRAGWSDEEINAAEITKIAEEAGAVAIAIHGRTRQQGYRGPANWNHIKECKEVAKTIQVIGNGDVMDAKSAKRMFEETGCDVVLVSRGTLGNPWIVEDIIRYLQEEEMIERTPKTARDALLDHFSKILDYQQQRRAIVDARRIGCWYIKKTQGTREFRQKMSRIESVEEAFDLIQNLAIE